MRGRGETAGKEGGREEGLEEGRKGRWEAGRDGNSRGKRGREGGWVKMRPGCGGVEGTEGRVRSEEGGWEREREREGHGWVVLVGGWRNVLVVIQLFRSE